MSSNNRYPRQVLLGSAAVIALSVGAAQAQTPSDGIEQVTVSSSRIQISGYEQPTPVTVLDSASLERDANVNVGDSIRQLPALGASGSPNNNVGGSNVSAANAGSDLANMRNLGFLRTLVLVDGQRVVASNITGGVDLSTIPTSVLSRVDVVTGGASAAWGSDAVAGVVNLVLNKNFEGIKANAEAGISTYGDHQQAKIEATYGTGFDGDRGHVIVSGQYTMSPDLIFPGSRQWFHNTQLVNNPAYTATNGQPKLIHANNVQISSSNQGGVILSGAAAGTTFGANGAIGTFSSGSGTGGSGSYIVGGSGGSDAGYLRDLVLPYRSSNLFGYASYKLTDDIKASVQLNYGNLSNINTSTSLSRNGGTSVMTIHQDNPYLPTSIAALYPANSTFTYGSTNTNNIAFPVPTLSQIESSVSVPVNANHRQLFRGVFTLEGSLGDDWSWNTFWQHSNARVMTHILHNQIVGNFNNAVDAVRVTAANVGTSGLTVGNIACRSTLTNPTNGCQPLNVFGTGVASQAAINYINTDANYQLQNLNQDEISGSMQGKLPWGLPAGQIAVAFGAEHRREAVRTFTDPGALAKLYNVGNFALQKGAYNVEEGFLEIDAPILKNDFVQSLDFTAAGRITSYSTSGLVQTWKLGATSQVNDDIKLRTSWSFDIRAPTLNDLFAAGSLTSLPANDPRTGVAFNGFQSAVGNANLSPESSTTISGGVVVTPHWVPGLSLSLDWYSINIKGAIYTTPALTEISQCKAGVAFYCNQILFNGPVQTGNGLTLPTASTVTVSPLNAAAATTSGLDFQADYTTPVYDGDLDLKLLGNYMDEQTQTALGVTTDYAGALSDDSIVNLGVPKFKMTAIATYNWGPWSGTVQGRVIGSAHLVNNYVTPPPTGTILPSMIDNNSVPAVAYMDLRASYAWDDNIKIYGAIDNLWNAPPPVVADGPASAQMVLATRADIYDTIGRMFRIGVRFNAD